MSRKHPDLFYNRGTVKLITFTNNTIKIYEFLSDYQLAVKDFIQASKIDPCLEAMKKVAKIGNHVKHCQYLIENNVRHF